MTRYLLIICLTMASFTTFVPTAAAYCYDGKDTETREPCTATATTPAPRGGGIFSCSAPGATSIASTVAIGGTYVPVFDSAVALNTGVLTYKECILHEVINQQKQAATLAMSSNNYKLISQGRDGNPMWVVRYGNELGKVSEQAYVNAFQSELLSKLNPAFQNPVKTALLRNRQMTTQAPQNALACSYQGDLKAALDGRPDDLYAALGALIDPACSPYSAYMLSQSQLDSRVAAAQTEWVNRLNWNNGIYDERDANGNVVVPGIFLNAIGTQSLTSGFRQLENADDIGELVGPLFAGIGSRILSNPASVASIQTAYDQAIQEQTASLLNSYVSTALNNLYKILGDEQQYNDILAQTADVLTNSINQLRTSEKACWELIVPKVCTGSSLSGNTCESGEGATLTVATSTAFSDIVISKAGMGPAADALKAAVDTSNANIATLNSLIASVQSADATTRNTAFANLDAIINANPPVLHTQSSITKAQEDLAAVQAQMLGTQGGSAGLVKQTQQAWAGDALDQYGSLVKSAVAWNGAMPPNGTDTGWCNINKQQTLDNWIQHWSQ